MGPAWALPEGAQVQSGSVALESGADGSLQVTASDQAIIQWSSFDIASNERVQFLQPSSTATVLNRVVGGQASQIAGSLAANGWLFLINPAGITFAPSARVEVGGLIASSLDLSNEAFLSRHYQFLQPAGATPASVVNRGTMTTMAPGGVLALLGGAVANHGTMTARLGTVALAAGAKTTLTLDLEGLLAVVVDEPTAGLVLGMDGRLPEAAVNTGTLAAEGGAVCVTAAALHQVFDRLVNQTGVLEATSTLERQGRIFLTASGGDVRLGGRVAASGGAQGSGGEIQIRAIGGDALVEPDAVVDLRGGAVAGHGGHGEISATGAGVVGGTVLGDAAPGYPRGTFLFDPTDVTISSNTTVTADTTFFATRNVNINANVTANQGAGLRFLADHNSATVQDWHDGTGNITQRRGKVVTTNGGGAVTFAGRNLTLANHGIQSSGDLSFYYNRDVTIKQTSNLTNKIMGFVGTLGLYATGELKLGSNLNSAALFPGTHHLCLESDSNLGGQDEDVVDFNGKAVDTRGGNLTVVSRGTEEAVVLPAVSAGTGAVTITAGGNLNDDGNDATRITAGTLTLAAGGRIGNTGSGQLDTSVDTLTAATTNGSIFVTNDRTLTVPSVTAGGAGRDVTITTMGFGELRLGTVTAADDLTLSAGSAIVDAGSLVTGDALTLTAGAAVGRLPVIADLGTAGAPIRVNVNSWTVDGRHGGVHLESATGDLTVTSQAIASGVATYGTSKGSMMAKAAGDLTLHTSAGSLTTAPALTFAGNLALRAGNNLAVNGNVTSTGAGTLTFVADSDGNGVGTFTQAAGSSIAAGTGAITVSAAGNPALRTLSTAGTMTVTATHGSLLDPPANLTTKALTLTAAGTIGAAATPATIAVTNGTATVSASGVDGDVSVNLNGTVAPGNTLTLRNTPPGRVLFNGVQLFPPAAPPPPQGRRPRRPSAKAFTDAFELSAFFPKPLRVWQPSSNEIWLKSGLRVNRTARSGSVVSRILAPGRFSRRR